MNETVQAARDREKARVSRLLDIVQRLSGDVWTMDSDNGQTHVLARRSSGEAVILCTIFQDALPEEIELIGEAFSNIALLLELRERSITAYAEVQRQLGRKGPVLREGNFAAQAAMLLSEPLFHRFLERHDTGGAIHNRDLADGALKRVLRIKSKTQINTVARAQVAFLQLRSDFEVWKRGVAA